MTVTTLPALRREVIVDADQTTAFAVFTERIGVWWPVGEHSVHGEGATVTFVEPGVGSRLVETKDGADDAVWGTVTRWQPDDVVSFTWHPGHGPEAASQVTVTFTPEGARTRVTLEHSGWEAFGDQAAQARENYDHGWPLVLDAYVGCVAAR
jgi:uncharacterized protein YndB with AHSA1/START domain